MILPVFLVSLFLVGVILSWLASFATRKLAWRWNAIAQPTGGRRVHQKPTPQLGGIGIGLTIILLILVGMSAGWFSSLQIRPLQLGGFVVALGILLAVGYADDRWDISAGLRLALYTLACLIIIISGTSIHQVTGISGHGLMRLDQWSALFSFSGRHLNLAFPGDLLTLLWLLAVLHATKFLDGLDGLVAGQTVIGAGLIVFLTLSAAFFQPAVAILAIIVLGAFAGFLPINMHPARQFLGESGSTIAGFSLGFLAIVSGAKVATAFMALGIPLVDALLVVVGRCLRGTSPFRGDDTHLHFKLVKSGLSKRQVVMLYWSVALVAGVMAFGFQTRGKFLLMLGLLIGTASLSWLAGTRSRSPSKNK